MDAAKGAVSLKFSNIEEAKNRIVCDAASTATEYPCTDALAEWTEARQPATANPDVELAFVYAGNTYDFFFSRFGRDSLNGAGLQLKSTVDYCPGQPAPTRTPSGTATRWCTATGSPAPTTWSATS